MTSGGYGYTVERSIAYAYLPAEVELGAAVEVDIFGKLGGGEVAREPLFDPAGSGCARSAGSASLPRLMSVTVVGSIAFDAVKTPFGARERMLGGSAVHFALAASFFDTVHVVGPVGDDFGEDEYEVLRARGVDTDDIEHVAGGQTFFWRASTAGT